MSREANPRVARGGELHTNGRIGGRRFVWGWILGEQQRQVPCYRKCPYMAGCHESVGGYPFAHLFPMLTLVKEQN